MAGIHLASHVSSPCQVDWSSNLTQIVCMGVPRDMLAGSVSGIDRLTGGAFGKASGLMPLVRDYAAGLLLSVPDLDDSTAGRVAGNLADLVSAWLADVLSRGTLDLSEPMASHFPVTGSPAWAARMGVPRISPNAKGRIRFMCPQ
ncbi:hypothetical protein [Duganella radicis]|uniref:Uncharacterized protein n=1 Tax=Duganella radicis TaxID=551988 RepID=A0A6L6PRH3_9BURK|nr:hypothetical protein [Duganella radicis]MTV41237.1 hypothetical protein [Duganella radicis]